MKLETEKIRGYGMSWILGLGGLPSKDSEGHRKYKSLSSNARAECMESGVIGVSISRLSDRKPSVLRIKLCEAKNPPHRTSQWSNEAWSEWESWGSWSLWGLALRSFFIVCVKKWWSRQRWGMKLRGWARHWRCWRSCGWPRCNRRWTYFLRLPHFYLRWCLNPISLSLSLSMSPWVLAFLLLHLVTWKCCVGHGIFQGKYKWDQCI